MVGIGLLLIAIGFASLWMRVKGILYSCRWYCRVLMFSGPIGFVAVIAGWVTTEVGRQPYTVYGLLKTVDSVAPIDALAVGLSLITFIITYFIIFGSGVFYIFKQFQIDPDQNEKFNNVLAERGGISYIVNALGRVKKTF